MILHVRTCLVAHFCSGTPWATTILDLLLLSHLREAATSHSIVAECPPRQLGCDENMSEPTWTRRGRAQRSRQLHDRPVMMQPPVRER